MNQATYFDKVYGCLLGGLIGDAMGAPSEAMDYPEIMEKLGYIEDFEGAGTDDSAIKLILCQAILESGGDISADAFAQSFLKNKDKYYPLFYIPVKNMFHKIESGLSLPVDAGYGNMHSSSSAMVISPMGLINPCDPRRAALETFDVAGLIHAGVSGFCRDGACAMAAAVAAALSPGATVESILEAAVAYLHPQSAAEMAGCIKDAIELVESCGSYEAFRDSFYKTRLRSQSNDSRETVPLAFALFRLAEGDPVKSVVYAANFGRDTDTIGTMTGALCGAYAGAGALKPQWVAKIEATYGQSSGTSKLYEGMEAQESVDQWELARQLMDITAKRMDSRKACLAAYDRLAALV